MAPVFNRSVRLPPSHRRPIDQKGAQQLSAGEVLVRLLPAESGELAILMAIRTTATDPLVKWIRDVTDLKKSAYVTAISRFSSPPQLTDVRRSKSITMTSTRSAHCHPASCDLKLTAAEMTALNIAGPDRRDLATRPAGRNASSRR